MILQVVDFMARETGLEPATSGVTGRRDFARLSIKNNDMIESKIRNMVPKMPNNFNAAKDGFGITPAPNPKWFYGAVLTLEDEMKKIPTIFERDWEGGRSRVVNIINGKCQWVFDGEGRATVKVDGTCCRVLNGELWKRRELRKGEPHPVGFEVADFDDETGKTVGWVRGGDRPEDRWHREAFRPGMEDGTYELVGPKIQGNPDKLLKHFLERHGETNAEDAPRTFDGLREWLSGKDIEGLVFHHPDGRMGKIKLRDFGLKRTPAAPVAERR